MIVEFDDKTRREFVGVITAFNETVNTVRRQPLDGDREILLTGSGMVQIELAYVNGPRGRISENAGDTSEAGV